MGWRTCDSPRGLIVDRLVRGIRGIQAPRGDVDELRPVTALFADVVGSTALGERLSPAEVKAVIGECVTRMCEVVEAFGGCVTGQMAME